MATAVGRLQASLAAATNEVTVAAANLNFDFTLVKYEAPKEYQTLGNVLSRNRRDNAEHGSSHRTARQLGALFDGVCPPTPHLLGAYGERASEIAKKSKDISEKHIHTLFGEYTGIDGTSIWAAATSSKAALHVHLLACMLARMWTAPEAIAIWVELVSERKKDIAVKLETDGGVSFALAAAVGQEITRSQLAAWDASARSWLRTADGVHQRNQKQLELILKNLDTMVNGDPKVFSSVTGAWSNAVETMDKLVAGMPQEVQNGATLLGLSAWHLYPDIRIFGSKIVSVDMNDTLVSRGGILSLGLSAPPRGTSDSGVYWSLSLAHLRHYGRPVRTERSLRDGARITFSQLKLVVFSAILTVWNIQDKDRDLVADIILRLVDCIKTKQHAESEDKLVQFLHDGASAFKDRCTGLQDLNHKLIQLGKRRAHSFFKMPDPHGHSGPGQRIYHESLFELFDLLKPLTFMSVFKDIDSQVVALRYIAAQLAPKSASPDTFVIRYNHDVSFISDLVRGGLQESDNSTTLDTNSSCVVSDDTVAGSEHDRKAGDDGMRVDRVKTKDEESERGPSKKSSFEFLNQFPHAMDEDMEEELQESSDDTDMGYSDDENEESEEMQDEKNENLPILHGGYAFTTALPISQATPSDFPIPQTSNTAPSSHSHHHWLPSQPRVGSIPASESYSLDAGLRFKSWDDSIEILGPSKTLSYGYLLGNPSSAALYSLRDSTTMYDKEINLRHLLWCLEHDIFQPVLLRKLILYTDKMKTDRVLSTLNVLSSAEKIYTDLVGATIDIGVFNRPILDTWWGRVAQEPGIIIGYPQAFSLISYFDSGSHDIEPFQLQHVIVLSSANSLFVPSAMIQDPSHSLLQSWGVSRILGNFGRSGLSFLLPPQDPMIRELDPDSWKVSSYESFDGSRAESFQSTSVHLSFTDFHAQLYDGSRGAHDNQISFLEAVISVRDRGKWVADIDPYPLINRQPTIRDFDNQAPCNHPKDTNSNRDIIAVDSWDEMLDVPEGVFVVRTGGNWIARLALTLVAHQRLWKISGRFAITICPQKVCWMCLQQTFARHAYIF